MKCYFNGSVSGEDQLATQAGTVSFAIPDIGVIFRSRWTGNLIECQYAALLSLLQFIETNKKAFKGKEIEIHSDASIVVYQLTKDSFILKSIEPYYRLVQTYKNKFAFDLRWVPEKENPALTGMIGTPPMKPSIDIQFEMNDKSDKGARKGGFLPLE